MTAAVPPILLVEDNPTARKMFRLTLEAEGFAVLEAADGRSALAHLARELPALVLQDFVLPDYDGFDLARAIRIRPGCTALPIVVMSGFPRMLERACSEPGCFDASLVKPVAAAHLIEVVRRYLAPPVHLTDRFGHGKTILIVDDDPVQLKLAGLRFTDVGFAVVTASDGLAALAIAAARPPDVILCDVLMPGTDGYELCVAVRETPVLARIPVILVSAHYGGAADEALARAAGARALVTRSPSLLETLDAVAACFAGDPVTAGSDAHARPRRSVTGPVPIAPFAQLHAHRVIAQLKRQARLHADVVERSALQTAQLSVLAGIADAIARSENIEDALRDVLAACLDAGGISRGALFRTDAQGAIALSFASGFPDDDAPELAELFGFSHLVLPDSHAAVVIVRDRLPERDAASFLARAGVDAAVIVPLMDGRVPIGALLLGTSIAGIDDHDLAVFGRSIGAHIAQALALAAAFARLQWSAEASRILSASLDVATTLASLGRLATSELAELCEIQIGDAPPVVYAAATLSGERAAALAELALHYPGRAVLGSADAAVDRAHGPAHGELLHRLAIDARAEVALVVNDRPLGTVTFAQTRGTRGFRGVDHVAMEDLARRAAIALDNARLYEATRDANRSKDEFLATVSHELRSPLNAILGWAQMLATDLSPAKHRQAIRAIERNAFAQSALINDLLDMSSIVSGTMQLETTDVELGPVVDAAIASLQSRLDAKQLTLRTTGADAVHVLIGDPVRLGQIVGNLVGNAIKFTPPGGHLAVELAERDGAIALTVADDGEGIDPMLIGHVFERFKQGDGSPSRVHGGLGLGLSITQRLVELHGGTIRAISPGRDRGARFEVVFPRAARSAPAALPVPAAPAATARWNALGGLSILVVDDEPDARDMIASLLEHCGAATRVAGSAAEALDAITQTCPDVLLSDLGMPDEDGYSLIRKIRGLSQGATLPAIALSGFVSSEDRRKALDAGFHVHLAKPVKLAELLSTIASVRAPSPAK
jgi:CheY-like chemotaxis protein